MKLFDKHQPIPKDQARDIARTLLSQLDHANNLAQANTCWGEEEALKALKEAQRDIGRVQRGER